MIGNVTSGLNWFQLWGAGYLVCLLLLFWFYKKWIADGRYEMKRIQVFYFTLSLILFYLAVGSPVAVIAAEELFSAHVLELMVVLFISVPLFILGLPKEFLRSFFWSYRMRVMLKFSTHPWVTATIFNVALSVYLVPSVFNWLQQHTLLLGMSQAALLAASFFMWWTIISPLPEMNPLSEPVRVLYVFVASVLLMPIGIFLLIASTPFYTVYAESVQQLLPQLNAVQDQQLAGGLLKVVQLSSYGLALFLLIVKWAKKEEEPDDDYPYYPGQAINGPVKK
ncbi:cytochrome c oxidase assembly protein [Bacillus thermotolerans]|uniref:CtaG protein n=1 Tax=Bacillus thermotolerans TaxID=1221996 RepID=A0A0F5HXW1_BACTR|nr:cytochrome c oxidase assembly protein [Bacillus thermotolerans]KKB37687.1 CtaG protein [Bacillus thermotolerans]